MSLSEVDCAALPRTAEHAGDRGLQPLVLIGDRQAHAVEPALLERAQELDPERARLDLADIQADHLAHAGLVHRVRDDDRLGHDPAVVADLDLLGVEPQVRVGALKRPLAERSTCSSSARHIALTRSLVIPSIPSCSTSRSTLRVDTPLTYASSTTATIACSERRRGSRNDGKYERPRPLLRDQQLDLADPRLPRPRPIPVAMRQPRLGATSPSPAPISAEISPSINSRATSATASLTKSSSRPSIALRDDIGNRHALTFGHRGVSIHVDCGNSRRVRRHGGRPSPRSTYPTPVTPLLPT